MDSDNEERNNDIIEHDIDIEEHDIFDNPYIKSILPDISLIKQEDIVYDEDGNGLHEFSVHNCHHNDCYLLPDADNSMPVVPRNSTVDQTIYEDFVRNQRISTPSTVALDYVDSYLGSSRRFCFSCLILFPSRILFRSHYINVHSKTSLESTKYEYNDIRNKCFSKPGLKKHMLIAQGAPNFMKTRVLEIVNLILKNGDPEVCFHCGRTYTSKKDLKSHLFSVILSKVKRNHDMNKIHEENDDRVGLKEINFECPVDEISVTEDSTLVTHKNLAANSSVCLPKTKRFFNKKKSLLYRCGVCSYYFRLETSLITHLREKHKIIKISSKLLKKEQFNGKCKFCDSVTRNEHSFNVHIHKKHKQYIYYESKVKTNLPQNETTNVFLENSVDTVDSDSCKMQKSDSSTTSAKLFYRCEVCSCYFKIKENCISHIHKKHNITDFSNYSTTKTLFIEKCKYCDSYFKDTNYYNTHIFVAHKAKYEEGLSSIEKSGKDSSGKFYEKDLKTYRKSLKGQQNETTSSLQSLYRCKVCSCYFKIKKNCICHIYKKHNITDFSNYYLKTKLFKKKCTYCNHLSKDTTARNLHILQAHKAYYEAVVSNMENSAIDSLGVYENSSKMQQNEAKIILSEGSDTLSVDRNSNECRQNEATNILPEYSDSLSTDGYSNEMQQSEAKNNLVENSDFFTVGRNLSEVLQNEVINLLPENAVFDDHNVDNECKCQKKESSTLLRRSTTEYCNKDETLLETKNPGIEHFGKHQRTTVTPLLFLFRCAYCSCFFKTERWYSFHLRKKHKIINALECPAIKRVFEKKCKYCNVHSTNPMLYNEHILKHHWEYYEKDVSCARYEDPIKEQETDGISTQLFYRCQVCTCYFKMRKNYMRHMHKKHKISDFSSYSLKQKLFINKCNYCDSLLKDTNYYNTHIFAEHKTYYEAEVSNLENYGVDCFTDDGNISKVHQNETMNVPLLEDFDTDWSSEIRNLGDGQQTEINNFLKKPNANCSSAKVPQNEAKYFLPEDSHPYDNDSICQENENSTFLQKPTIECSLDVDDNAFLSQQNMTKISAAENMDVECFDKHGSDRKKITVTCYPENLPKKNWRKNKNIQNNKSITVELFFRCPYCSCYFKNKKHFYNHLRKKHKIVNLGKNIPVKTVYNRKCRYCNLLSKNQKSYNEHVHKKHSDYYKKYITSKVNKKYITRNVNKKHITGKSNKKSIPRSQNGSTSSELLYRCEVCSCYFKVKKNCFRHIYKKHKITNLSDCSPKKELYVKQCKYCNTSFKDIYYYNTHILQAHKDNYEAEVTIVGNSAKGSFTDDINSSKLQKIETTNVPLEDSVTNCSSVTVNSRGIQQNKTSNDHLEDSHTNRFLVDDNSVCHSTPDVEQKEDTKFVSENSSVNSYIDKDNKCLVTKSVILVQCADDDYNMTPINIFEKPGTVDSDRHRTELIPTASTSLPENLDSKFANENSSLKKENERISLLFRCPHCSCYLKTEKFYNLHLRKKHKIFNPLEYPAIMSVFKKHCKYCNLFLGNRKSYNKHIHEEHTDYYESSQALYYRCEICSCYFVKKRTFVLHTIEKHKVSKVSRIPKKVNFLGKCRYCEVPFDNIKIHNVHVYDEHYAEVEKVLIYRANQEFFYKCYICSFYFASFNLFTQHLENKHNLTEILEKQVPFDKTCRFCDLLFQNRNDYNAHLIGTHSQYFNVTSKDLKVVLDEQNVANQITKIDTNCDNWSNKGYKLESYPSESKDGASYIHSENSSKPIGDGLNIYIHPTIKYINKYSLRDGENLSINEQESKSDNFKSSVSTVDGEKITQNLNNSDIVVKQISCDKIDFKSLIFKCDACKIHFTSATLAVNHKEHKNCLINWKCSVCCNIFMIDDKTIHLKQHSFSNNLIIKNLVPSLQSKVLYCCPNCTIHFLEESILEHLEFCETKTSHSTYCYECDILIDSTIFKTHQEEHQANNLTRIDFAIIYLEESVQYCFGPVSNKRKEKDLCKCLCCGLIVELEIYSKYHSSGNVETDFYDSESTSASAVIKCDDQKIDDATLVGTSSVRNAIYLCKVCDIIVENYDRVIEHCQNHFTTPEIDITPIKCLTCGLSFEKTNYESHHDIHSQPYEVLQFDIFYYTSEKKVWLSHLFKSWQETDVNEIVDKSIYKFEHRIILHLEQDGQADLTLYKCETCLSFIHGSSLHRHAENSCFKLRQHHCSFCGIAFASSDSKLDHEKIHCSPNITIESYRIVSFNRHDDKTFNSEFCNPLFVLYQCRNCLGTSDTPKNHLCDAENLKLSVCCGLLFVKKEIKLHVQRHKDLKCFVKKNFKVLMFGEKEDSHNQTQHLLPTFQPIFDYTLYRCNACALCVNTSQCILLHRCASGSKCEICELNFSDLKTHRTMHKDKHFVKSNIRIVEFDPLIPDELKINFDIEKLNENTSYVFSNVDQPKSVTLYKCTCDLHFLNKLTLLTHKEKCCNWKKLAKVKCSHCELLFTTNDFYVHWFIHHKSKQNIILIIISSDSICGSSTVTCETNSTITTDSIIVTHNQTFSPVSFETHSTNPSFSISNDQQISSLFSYEANSTTTTDSINIIINNQKFSSVSYETHCTTEGDSIRNIKQTYSPVRCETNSTIPTDTIIINNQQALSPVSCETNSTASIDGISENSGNTFSPINCETNFNTPTDSIINNSQISSLVSCKTNSTTTTHSVIVNDNQTFSVSCETYSATPTNSVTVNNSQTFSSVSCETNSSAPSNSISNNKQTTVSVVCETNSTASTDPISVSTRKTFSPISCAINSITSTNSISNKKQTTSLVSCETNSTALTEPISVNSRKTFSPVSCATNSITPADSIVNYKKASSVICEIITITNNNKTFCPTHCETNSISITDSSSVKSEQTITQIGCEQNSSITTESISHNKQTPLTSTTRIQQNSLKTKKTLFKCTLCSLHFVNENEAFNHVAICADDSLGWECSNCHLFFDYCSLALHRNCHQIDNFEIIDIKID